MYLEGTVEYGTQKVPAEKRPYIEYGLKAVTDGWWILAAVYYDGEPIAEYDEDAKAVKWHRRSEKIALLSGLEMSVMYRSADPERAARLEIVFKSFSASTGGVKHQPHAWCTWQGSIQFVTQEKPVWRTALRNTYGTRVSCGERIEPLITLLRECWAAPFPIDSFRPYRTASDWFSGGDGKADSDDDESFSCSYDSLLAKIKLCKAEAKTPPDLKAQAVAAWTWMTRTAAISIKELPMHLDGFQRGLNLKRIALHQTTEREYWRFNHLPLFYGSLPGLFGPDMHFMLWNNSSGQWILSATPDINWYQKVEEDYCDFRVLYLDAFSCRKANSAPVGSLLGLPGSPYESCLPMASKEVENWCFTLELQFFEYPMVFSLWSAPRVQHFRIVRDKKKMLSLLVKGKPSICSDNVEDMLEWLANPRQRSPLKVTLTSKGENYLQPCSPDEAVRSLRQKCPLGLQKHAGSYVIRPCGRGYVLTVVLCTTHDYESQVHPGNVPWRPHQPEAEPMLDVPSDVFQVSWSKWRIIQTIYACLTGDKGLKPARGRRRIPKLPNEIAWFIMGHLVYNDFGTADLGWTGMLPGSSDWIPRCIAASDILVQQTYDFEALMTSRASASSYRTMRSDLLTKQDAVTKLFADKSYPYPDVADGFKFGCAISDLKTSVQNARRQVKG